MTIIDKLLPWRSKNSNPIATLYSSCFKIKSLNRHEDFQTLHVLYGESFENFTLSFGRFIWSPSKLTAACSITTKQRRKALVILVHRRDFNKVSDSFTLKISLTHPSMTRAIFPRRLTRLLVSHLLFLRNSCGETAL